MAFALEEVRYAACLACLATLPGASAKEPAAEGVEAATGASLACEALVQGLVVGVLGIAAAALKDRCGPALRSLRERRRAASQEAARLSPADAAAVVNPTGAPAGAAATASPRGGGGRPAVPPWAKAAAPAAAEAATGPPPAQRLALPKPGRGARVLQMQSKVAEFCSLRFDEVGTTEQMGLTCRMLAILKSFAQDVTYWDEAIKIDEPAFSLLDLDEVAQFALLRAAERAEELVDERCWREAYQELCNHARPWLPSESDGGPTDRQRAEAMAEMARAEERARLESEELQSPSLREPRDSSAAERSPAPDSAAIVVRLPAGSAGRVIGPHAATVTALQAETGARVWLDKAKDEAHVSGPPDAVEAARRGIRFLLTPVRGGGTDASPQRAPRASKREGAPVMCRFFRNGTCNKGSACHFLHVAAQPSSDDEETRASTDDEPLGGTSVTSSRNASQNASPARSRTSSGGGKPARGPAGAVSLSGIWQECPDVAYRVQAHGELSWTRVLCGSGGASGKEPIGYDEAAGVYWMGASRAHVAVRAGPDRLDWYLAGDRERPRPAFSWLRQQRRHPAPA